MIGGLIWAAVALVLGTPFVLIWWRLADNWADEEHKRFKTIRKTGPEPRVVRRRDIEGDRGEGEDCIGCERGS